MRRSPLLKHVSRYRSCFLAINVYIPWGGDSKSYLISSDVGYSYLNIPINHYTTRSFTWSEQAYLILSFTSVWWDSDKLLAFSWWLTKSLPRRSSRTNLDMVGLINELPLAGKPWADGIRTVTVASIHYGDARFQSFEATRSTISPDSPLRESVSESEHQPAHPHQNDVSRNVTRYPLSPVSTSARPECQRSYHGWWYWTQARIRLAS